MNESRGGSSVWKRTRRVPFCCFLLVFASQLVLGLCWSQRRLRTGSSGHEREGGELFGVRVKMLPAGYNGAGAL